MRNIYVVVREVVVSFHLRMLTHDVLFMLDYRHRPGWGF